LPLAILEFNGTLVKKTGVCVEIII